MGTDNSIPNSNHEITTIENLLHDLKIFNWALNQPHMQQEFNLSLKINLISNISSFLHRKLWFLLKKSLKFTLVNRKDKKEDILRTISVAEFYEFYDMIENYDILISGKAWDVLDLDQIFTSKIKDHHPPNNLELENKNDFEFPRKVMENEINLEKTPKVKDQTPSEDDICVICFDKKIQMILNNCFHGYCEDCCQKWILDKSKNECPLCRALVANTRSKLYKQAIVKENNQDVQALLKDNIVSFIAKIK